MTTGAIEYSDDGLCVLHSENMRVTNDDLTTDGEYNSDDFSL